jgi:hypothetical protein
MELNIYRKEVIIIYIVYKNTLIKTLERYYDADAFASMMTETNDISSSILRAKKIRENAGIKNYARIPSFFFSPDFKPLENEMLDRLFILIAGYIVTFCGTYSRIKIDKLADKININKDTLRDYIEQYGERYRLEYEVEKDRFRRVWRYIKYRR